ncbi:MAG: slipin family protein [Candidatus Eisenbacteria bacterium]|nr:slipin family protein [Candidatus Eisenbacteria bacterium]
MVPVMVAATQKRKSDDSKQSAHEKIGGIEARRDGRRHVNGVSATLAVIVWVGGVLGTVAMGGAGIQSVAAFLGILIGTFTLGLYLLFAIKVVDQWERAVVLRFGRFRGLKGPGIFTVIPVVDVVSHLVDQRVRATDVWAESALTRDTVPVNVDAIVFWLVWDAEKSVLEVQSYFDAIFLASQTALREAIGRHDLAEMITEREQLGQGLQQILDEKTNPWGITVQSVEIRDVRIPAELEDAMSRQAQAERERQARIILGTAETEIASLFAKASELYRDNEVAMHLRAMNMLYEAIKEKGSMVIVPSTAVQTMGLGGMLATTALASHPASGSADASGAVVS